MVMQYHPTSITSKAKSRTYRIAGLTNKFTRTSDLQTFQKRVKKHLVDHGMDTITYVTSPTDAKQVVSIIDHHGLFTLDEGCKAGNDLKTNHFDLYCLDNDNNAKDFLIASVDADIEEQLLDDCDEEDSFVAMWLNLIHIVRSVSILKFEKIKEQVAGRSLSQYAGENIEAICSDWTNDYKELHGARMYDHNLTMKMLERILEAGGGQDNERFRHPLREVAIKLEAKLLEVRHMSYDEAHRSLARVKLDVKSVLKKAKLEYRKVYDNGKWPAAAHVRDTKGMNKNYGQVNKATHSANSLVQSAGNSKRGKPAKGRKTQAKEHNSKNKSARNNPNKNGSRGTPPSGIRTPPKRGESETKFFGEDQRWWCQKCERWTLSHGTDGHKTKEQLKAEAEAKAKMA